MTQTAKEKLLIGNCLDTLKTLPDNSIDSIVTDPPYELGFMGKSWDNSGVAYQVSLWQECLRVLKPGGHLLAFGGTRTYHRMAVAIEDAGFEIRDSIHWTYGSGFPKSLNISKAIDKAAKVKREVVATTKGAANQKSPNTSTHAGASIGGQQGGLNFRAEYEQTAPATEAAKKWDGWGTALKPSHEPIVVARKPLTGTVADTVLQHGTGGINIDGTRIGTAGGTAWSPTDDKGDAGQFGGGIKDGDIRALNSGRFPANTLLTHNHDCQDTCTPNCPVDLLDKQSGESISARGSKGSSTSIFGGTGVQERKVGHNDAGGASRFFHNSQWIPADDITPFIYQAKASKKERDAGLSDLPEKEFVQFQTANGTSGKASSLSEGRDTKYRNTHPTVKPIELMRYLIKLITPPKGTVLDPFLGSGTTAVAAILEGFDWKGCEMTEDYIPIIKGRVKWAEKEVKKKAKQEELNLDTEA